jgi:hypothetical protein
MLFPLHVADDIEVEWLLLKRLEHDVNWNRCIRTNHTRYWRHCKSRKLALHLKATLVKGKAEWNMFLVDEMDSLSGPTLEEELPKVDARLVHTHTWLLDFTNNKEVLDNILFAKNAECPIGLRRLH